MAGEAQDRASEAPLTPLEMLQLMIEQGAPTLAIENQRRLCGLPATERPEPKITLRPVVAVSAPRPRRRQPRRATKPAPAKDPVAQAKGRFDLLEFEDTDNA